MTLLKLYIYRVPGPRPCPGAGEKFTESDIKAIETVWNEAQRSGEVVTGDQIKLADGVVLEAFHNKEEK